MRELPNKIFQATDNLSLEVRAFTVSNENSVIDIKFGDADFFRVIVPTSSTVEEIEASIKEKLK